MFSLRLAPGIEERLEKVAILRGRPKTHLIIEAVEDYLDKSPELRHDMTDDELKELDSELLLKKYDDFVLKRDRWNSVLLKQFQEICGWISRGNVWAHKPNPSGNCDGCPHGTNYVLAYTVLNGNESNESLAVIVKNIDSTRGIETRHRYVIDYEIWKEKMFELDTKK